jgi:polyhydroxyalkanoate synthesis regulator phasin
MPKKNPGMTPEEQSEQFKREAQKLIDAGELNPTEADAALDRLVTRAKDPKG